MSRDTGGLREGTAGRQRVTFLNSGEPVNLLGRTVSCECRFDTLLATTFQPTVVVLDQNDFEGAVDVIYPVLVEHGDLAHEFTISGDPIINPNARPLIVPVRERFKEAV